MKIISMGNYNMLSIAIFSKDFLNWTFYIHKKKCLVLQKKIVTFIAFILIDSSLSDLQ